MDSPGRLLIAVWVWQPASEVCQFVQKGAKAVRRLEEYEAEAWISDIPEWVWYTTRGQWRKRPAR